MAGNVRKIDPPSVTIYIRDKANREAVILEAESLELLKTGETLSICLAEDDTGSIAKGTAILRRYAKECDLFDHEAVLTIKCDAFATFNWFPSRWRAPDEISSSEIAEIECVIKNIPDFEPTRHSGKHICAYNLTFIILNR